MSHRLQDEDPTPLMLTWLLTYGMGEPTHLLSSGPLSPIVLQICFSSLSYSESLSSCSVPQGVAWKDSDESQVEREKTGSA